jgi:hypothetical protein
MKYINSYKVFENSTDIVDDIKDILLPISDIGANINICDMDYFNKYITTAEITPDKNLSKITGDFFIAIECDDIYSSIDISNFIEDLERLNRYINNFGYKLKVSDNEVFGEISRDTYQDLTEDFETYINKRKNGYSVYNLTIFAKKL